MLVLSRKKNETVVIKNSIADITVTVGEIVGDRVKLLFSAPDDIIIVRKELADNIAKEVAETSSNSSPEKSISERLKAFAKKPKPNLPDSWSTPDSRSTDHS